MPPSSALPTPDRRAVAALGGFYFFSFGALGAFFPFLPLLLSSRGLDPEQISWVMVLTPVANLFVPPLWGLLADALHARLVLLRIACIGAGAATLLFLPSWKLAGCLLAAAALSLFRSPLTSLGDAAAVSVLHGRGCEFGHVRVWGSVGFGTCVLSIGLMGASGRSGALVAAAAGAYVLAAACTAPLRSGGAGRTAGVAREVGSILRELPIIALLLASALHYIAHGAYDAFFSLHLRRAGYGDAFVGAAWAVGISVEIAFMLLSRRLLDRTGGAGLLAVCSSVACVRWLMLATFVHPAVILCAQMLHGVTFGLWYLALVRTIQRRAPDRLRTSLQSIAFACMGLGMVVGYLGGGVLFARLNGHALFAVAAGCAALAACLYLVSWKRSGA